MVSISSPQQADFSRGFNLLQTKKLTNLTCVVEADTMQSKLEFKIQVWQGLTTQVKVFRIEAEFSQHYLFQQASVNQRVFLNYLPMLYSGKEKLLERS